ncbi:MAG: DEAD/DEAH box helicase [Nostocoides sp.]
MPKATSGTPKKARWTAAQKAAARRSKKKNAPNGKKATESRAFRGGAGIAPDKPPRKPHHRGQARPEGMAAKQHGERGEQPREDRRPERREDRRPERREDRRPERRAPRVAGGTHHAERQRRLDADLAASFQQDSGDEWTKYTSRGTAAPAQVTADNGFAALGVPGELVERLARDGITEPFPIQAAAIPDALAGRDVLGRGRTGSGKTFAFGLPLLARLAGGRANPRMPRSLILVPTRELAMQVTDALEPLVHVLRLRHKLVAGGLSYEPQISALARGVDVLVATPGRLSDLLQRGAADLSEVEVIVLDEADHMAAMGFLEDMTGILDQVPPGGQRLLFSATLDAGVDALVERYLTDPVTHSTDDATAAVETMSHRAFLVDPRDKKAVTAQLANRSGRTVVFVRTKLGADRVARELRDAGVLAAALHGGLTQGARNRVLGAFRAGKLPVLVATDVAARGIHVDDVSVVLQVDPPADHKDYLHRAGRTARAGEEGTVITLALPHQRRAIERMFAEAGVATTPQRVAPGEAPITQAGGRETSGVPVQESQFRALVEPPSRGRRPGPARGTAGRGGAGGRSGPNRSGRSARNFSDRPRERRVGRDT